MNNEKLESEIAEALEHLNPASLNYSEWVSVGMALKNEGFPADTWESWSAKDPERYHPGECLKKWNTFERTGTGKGTIFLLCKQHSGHTVSGSRYKYSGEITEETIIEDPVTIRWTEPGQDWNPLEDMQKYISVLFNPAEYVGYCVNSRQDQKTGKYIPKTGGNYDRTAERLLRELSSAERIEDVFYSYDLNAGAWIRFNPLDGAGAKDENVTDYRFTLIESDNMPINEQIQKYIDLKLPIAALVHSGGKSAHAIVRVNAKTKEEYNSRIDLLYSELKRNGFETDTQNRNPSRLSRAPGFMRNGKKQYLIAVNIGMPSWEAWAAGREETETEYISQLPQEIPYDYLLSPPPLKRPIITGYMREHEAMLISGQSKAGKSFLTAQLAHAIATGGTWIGQKCNKKSVLYIDGELSSEMTAQRFKAMREKMRIPVPPEELHVINARGNGVTLEAIAEDISHDCHKYDVIIIDPLYMFIESDENDNSQMKNEMHIIAKICACGCSVIVIHHMAKGIQTGKFSIDRASGAGVIGRFFDSILTVNKLETEPGDTGTPERIEADTRSFSQPAPVHLWFNDGFHNVDTSGELSFRSLANPQKVNAEKKNDDDVAKINHCYHWMKENGKLDDQNRFTVNDLMSAYDQCYSKTLTISTATRHLEKAGYIKMLETVTENTRAGKRTHKVNYYMPDGSVISEAESEAESEEPPPEK